MGLKIVQFPDERLREVCAEIEDFALAPKLSRQMLQFMQLNRGVGLAGPQIGVNQQIFVMSGSGMAATGRAFVNPKILWTSTERSKKVEGCLSIPGVEIEVERPEKIRASFQDITGADYEEEFDDWEARIFQHEYDHLFGRLIVDLDGNNESPLSNNG